MVRGEGKGELPVSFKAEHNGIYTLTIESQGVDMNYLHLIDNLTGAYVNLLQSPSYSFEAKTTDYASRFKLVFSVCKDADGDNNFAYYNGSEWVVANEDNATLQVVDIMGRVLQSTDNARTVSISNLVPGVYTLRLINSENVKTQKIVVR